MSSRLLSGFRDERRAGGGLEPGTRERGEESVRRKHTRAAYGRIARPDAREPQGCGATS